MLGKTSSIETFEVLPHTTSMDQSNVMQVLSYVWPIIVIQVGLQIYAIIDILRKKNTKTLSVPAWIVIVLLGNMLGAIAYLVIGKADDLSD